MAFFGRRQPAQVDRIRPEDLANFGRFEFLGEEGSGLSREQAVPEYLRQTGVDAMIASMVNNDPSQRNAVIAELLRHGEVGEWEKVGAWKFVREFLDDDKEAIQPVIDAGLLALSRMRVTNLSVHLAPIDSPRYTELTGERPPNDGFFGPPVFDSNFGPTRQYYFDHAISTAAARRIARLPSDAGIEPGPLDNAVRAMWDFGLLIYRGPLVVNPDIRFEPNVVRPAVTAASGVDHGLFTDRLADAALDTSGHTHGVWTSLGGTRFVEEYLDPTATDSPGYSRLLDSGINLLLSSGFLGVGMSPELLTARQRERLNELR